MCQDYAGKVEPLADTLLTRIIVREKAKAQAEFLRLLYDSPLSHELIFRGSTAIHGVFVSPYHQRFGCDLDFYADKALIGELRKNPNKYNLSLRSHTRSDETQAIVFEYRGLHPQGLLLPVDICVLEPTVVSEHPAMFTSLQEGKRLPVRRVMSLNQLIAEKLRALVQRGTSTDYLDLWLVMKAQAIDTLAVKKILRNLMAVETIEWDGVASAINTAQPNWSDELVPSLRIPLPSFDVVRNELQRWLTEFSRL